jgi:hypothetical protein
MLLPFGCLLPVLMHVSGFDICRECLRWHNCTDLGVAVQLLVKR